MGSMSTQTITGFLLERIAEDERHARKLAETDRRPVLSLATTINHPQRLLAECAAKRALIGWHYCMSSSFGGFEDSLCAVCGEAGPGAQGYPCDTLKALAAVYADHEDYQEAWAL